MQSLPPPRPPTNLLNECSYDAFAVGGTFPVEWAMGHEGTKGNWVLVRAEDEMKLKAWDDQLASRYFAAAPATEKFKSYFVDDKTVSNIDKKKQKGNCGVKAGTRVFSKEVDIRTAYNRPAHFEQFAKSGGYKFYEYNSAMDTNCHRCPLLAMPLPTYL